MSDTIIRFPNSKRRLTPVEEQTVRMCANIIHNAYQDDNPFVREEQRIIHTEKLIRECIKKIFELNEEENGKS
jgi:hypothetical protein